MTAPEDRPVSPWERLEWEESREGWRPWAPPSAPWLADAEPSYVVVDEIVGEAVGVSIHPWPLADHEGRLRFVDHGDGRFCGTNRSELHRWVVERRLAALPEAPSVSEDALARRPVAIGDVFAATVLSDAATAAPGELLAQDLVDVTIDAREAAKLAFYSAVGRPLSADEVDRWINDRDEDDEPPTATGTPMPVPR